MLNVTLEESCTVLYYILMATCFLTQVLTSLEPLDYLVVAFLPGVSEVGSVIIFASHS